MEKIKSHSLDLREHVIDYVSGGGSQISASSMFKVGHNTICNWLHRERAIEFGVTHSGMWLALRKLKINKKTKAICEK